MKKNILYFTVFALVFAIALFSMAFSISYINTCDSYYSISYAGTEIMFQYKFVPYADTDLEAMNNAIKEKHDNYTGYSYYNPVSKFIDQSGTQHYAYMTADSVKIDLFYALSEGVSFREANAPENTYPVIVGGDYYKSYKVGDTFTMRFKDIHNGSDIVVMAYVSGKMSISKWPEYVETEQLTEMAKDGYVFCDDTYLESTVDLFGRALYLNRDTTKGGMLTEETKAFKEDASYYGVFVDAQGYFNSTINKLLEDKSDAQFLLAIAVILVLASVAAFIYNSKEKAQIIMCTMAMVMAFILNITAIFIFNTFMSQTLLYISSVSIIITLAIFAAGFIASLIRYLIVAKKDKKISEGKNYEEI